MRNLLKFLRKISKLRTYSLQFGSLEKFNRFLTLIAGFCLFKLSSKFNCPTTALLLPHYPITLLPYSRPIAATTTATTTILPLCVLAYNS